jgi:hypothetical protein
MDTKSKRKPDSSEPGFFLIPLVAEGEATANKKATRCQPDGLDSFWETREKKDA